MALTEFVLITMIWAGRSAGWIPVSAEIFPSKAACELAVKNSQKQYCVPRIRTLEQK